MWAEYRGTWSLSFWVLGWLCCEQSIEHRFLVLHIPSCTFSYQRELFLWGFFGMGLFFLIPCCSWQAGTCGSWLCISLAWDVWLSKRDYLTGLLPPASWHCWPVAALHTKEKRSGNTREEIKFSAGCAAWAWLRVQWESHVGGRWFTEPNSWIYWKAKTWSVVIAESDTARLCFARTLFFPCTGGKEISVVLLWVVMVGTECFKERLFLANEVLCLFSSTEMTRYSLYCSFPTCTTFPVDSASLVFGKCTLALRKALQLFFLIIYPKELD